MTLFAALTYSVVMVVSAGALIAMYKIQPDSVISYLVWVFSIDLSLFWFLFLYSSNVILQTV